MTSGNTACESSLKLKQNRDGQKFHSAIAAIKAGDLELLKSLVQEDPTLATERSTRSHPTLLQCLVLDARDVLNQIEMAKVLVDAGAEINGPLVAAASGNNKEAVAFLLDCGAAINGWSEQAETKDSDAARNDSVLGKWSPLEEALYWGNDEVRDLLLERGASIHNLRIAAGLGRVDLIEQFFSSDGTLKHDAGEMSWPFQDPLCSNLPRPKKERLQAMIDSWSNDSRSLINNAFIYACMHGHLPAAEFLLNKGAQINSIPAGFHYPGTALHHTAGKGQLSMVKFLIERGADPKAMDVENAATPAGWAAHGRHREVQKYLESF